MPKQFKSPPPPPPKKPRPPRAENPGPEDEPSDDAPAVDTDAPAPAPATKRTRTNKDHHNKKRVKPKPQGRPRYAPDEHDMEQVKAMAGYGLREDQIWTVLGISERTWKRMRKVFAPLVEAGRAFAAASVGQALFNGAVAGDTGKIVWYEKTRLGRTDKIMVEASGPDGAPLQIENEVHGEVDVTHSGVIGIYLPSNGRDDFDGPTDEGAPPA